MTFNWTSVFCLTIFTSGLLWTLFQSLLIRTLDPVIDPENPTLFTNDPVLSLQSVDYRLLSQKREELGAKSGFGLGYIQATLPKNILDIVEDDNINPQDGDEDDAADITAEDENEKANISLLRPLHVLSRLTQPLNKGIDNVVPSMPQRPPYTKIERNELTWGYLMDEKLPPYVGDPYWMSMFVKGSRKYINSLAVFPYASRDEKPIRRYHGRVGVYPNGTQLWSPVPVPLPIDKVNRTAVMKNGGFYLEMSNALPMDRKPADYREGVCKAEKYDYRQLDDASVVITFYNEPLSTLLRSVHSVLNYTPPPLLREIILVDDHSSLPENLPGGDLYEYIKLLPKTKLLRLPERKGLVWARMAGAQAATGKVLVVLDSHIEVSNNWLEPQLQRIKNSPKSIVFPQIMALDPATFVYEQHAGIGCWISWKWNMVEQSTLTGDVKDTKAIASPCMAGGLFAVDLDWFWELGGYDEAFGMWGSENVEMGFRTWMCGGRLECTPCSRTFHIYRSGGVGYSSPSEAVHRNQHRTARLWMDEWYQITSRFLPENKYGFGDLNPILDLKERLKCKPFKWFLENIDPTHEGRILEDIEILGDIRSFANNKLCLDTMGAKAGGKYGVFWCHNSGGTQGWMKIRDNKHVRSVTDTSLCLGEKNFEPVFGACSKPETDIWTYDNTSHQLKVNVRKSTKCLTIMEEARKVALQDCRSDDIKQKWNATHFTPDPNFELPKRTEMPSST